MSKPSPADQRLSAKQAVMPAKLAELHFHLEDELLFLNFLWEELAELFDTNDRRIDVINATAPTFFVYFNDLAWHETMLRLCVITDPTQSVGKNNLTLKRLPAAIPDATLKARIEKEVQKAYESTKFARDWRNRGLAHLSLDLVQNPQAKPLAKADHKAVREALEALAVPLNSISAHYQHTHVDFAGGSRPFGGAKGLIYFLSSGLEADQARKNSGA